MRAPKNIKLYYITSALVAIVCCILGSNLIFAKKRRRISKRKTRVSRARARRPQMRRRASRPRRQSIRRRPRPQRQTRIKRARPTSRRSRSRRQVSRPRRQQKRLTRRARQQRLRPSRQKRQRTRRPTARPAKRKVSRKPSRARKQSRRKAWASQRKRKGRASRKKTQIKPSQLSTTTTTTNKRVRRKSHTKTTPQQAKAGRKPLDKITQKKTSPQKLSIPQRQAARAAITKRVRSAKRPPRYTKRYRHYRYYRWKPRRALSFGLFLGSGGTAFGLGIGYTRPYHYFWNPLDPFWGNYYYHRTGTWYYPDYGFWYHPRYHSWYYPWLRSWYFPTYNAWYYPHYGFTLFSYTQSDDPYIVIDNDTGRKLYYAIYEKDSQSLLGDASVFFKIASSKRIRRNRSRKLYLPRFLSNKIMIIARHRDDLQRSLTEQAIRALNLVTVDLSSSDKEASGVSLRQEIRDARLSRDQERDLERFKDEIRHELRGELHDMGESIRSEMREEKE